MKPLSILITGASTGIGYATALDLAEEGHQVFAGVRTEEDAARLKLSGAGIIPVILDVTNPAQILAAKDLITRERKEKKFCLINNAGTAMYGPVEAVSMSDLRAQFEVNFFGLVAVTQALLPLIRATHGRIINMSSVSGRVASPFLGPYSASKFALEGLTDSLRRELIPLGVKVILVEPGPIETPIWEKGFGSKDECLSRMNPEILNIYAQPMKSFEQEVQRAVESADPVDYVVDAIKLALFARFPRHRYLVGKQALMNGVASYLPSRIVDVVVNQRMKSLN